jgi:cytochrome c
MQDPLFVNKIFGAILASALIFFGLPQLANAVLGGGGHHGKHHEVKFAYAPELKLEAGQSNGDSASADLGTLLAAANPDGGKRRTALCASCHSFEKGGPNLQGPNLYGVVGAPVANHAGFTYSAALKAFGGAWTYERLNEFLKQPQKAVPGTAMSFAGIAKPEQRAEVLAYLRTLSDAPVDFPAPAAAPAAAADAAPSDAASAAPAGQATPEAADTSKEPG